MKKVIFKYHLEIGRTNKLSLPVGAEILSIQAQNEECCLWALVDLNKQPEERLFEIYGTGQNIYYDMGVERKFIGTFQLQEGKFVGHVFERIN